MAYFPSVNPSYSLIKIPMFRTHVVEYGNKVEQRLARDSAARYKFQMNFTKLNSTDANSIVSFFITCKGRFTSFSLVNPEDSQIYTVRFDDDVMNLDYFMYQLYNLNQVNFIQVSA